MLSRRNIRERKILEQGNHLQKSAFIGVPVWRGVNSEFVCYVRGCASCVSLITVVDFQFPFLRCLERSVGNLFVNLFVRYMRMKKIGWRFTRWNDQVVFCKVVTLFFWIGSRRLVFWIRLDILVCLPFQAQRIQFPGTEIGLDRLVHYLKIF